MHIHTTLLEFSLRCAIYYHMHCIGERVPVQNVVQKAIGMISNTNPLVVTLLRKFGINRQRKRQDSLSSLTSPFQQVGDHLVSSGTSGSAGGISASASASAGTGQLPAQLTVQICESSKILKKLGIQNGDIEICEHFAELIKQQQQIELAGSDYYTTSIRLDVSAPCETYRNQNLKQTLI